MDVPTVVKLTTRPIPDVANAAAHLSEVRIDRSRDCNYRHVAMVLVPERGLCSFHMVIPEGVHAVVESSGRFVGIWPPGLHCAGPWIRVSHLVSKQFIVFESPVKECPTMDNVMVEIDVSVVVHVKDDPKSVESFAYKLGPERLDQMLTAYQEEAIRTMARKKTYTKIYDLMDTEVFDDLAKDSAEEKKDDRQIEMTTLNSQGKKQDDDDEDHREQLENIKRNMNEKLSPYGVEIYSITITNVRLPHSFAQEMEQATTFASKNAYAAIEQRYKITVLNDEEKRRQLTQKLKEDREEKEALHQQILAEENRLLNAVHATTAQRVAEIEEAHRAEKLTLSSESQLKVAKIEKQTEVLKASIAAQATAQSEQIGSERDAFVARSKAKAQMEIAKNKAETLRLRAQSEKVCATKLKGKRDFDIKMQQLRVVKSMSENKQVTVSGKNTDNVLAQILAAREAAGIFGLIPPK